MVDLTHIELATEEDKVWKIDHWARLFTATTWEEVKMITENNIHMEEAAKEMYVLSADEMIEERCRARNDYYRTIRTYNKTIQDLEESNETLLIEKQTLLDENQSLLGKNQMLLSEKETLLGEKETLLSEKEILLKRIAELESKNQ